MAAADSETDYSQHHQMAIRAAARARAGVALVLALAELHRLLVQQRYVKAFMEGNIRARRALLQSVYLMQRRTVFPSGEQKKHTCMHTKHVPSVKFNIFQAETCFFFHH